MAREDPILIPGEKVKETLRKFRETHFRMVSCFPCPYVGCFRRKDQPNKIEYFSLKKDILDEIVAHMVPETILTNVRDTFVLSSHGQYLTFAIVHDSYDGHAIRSLANEETIYPPTCRVMLYDTCIFPHQQATE
jgi:hypothetical protein